MTTTQTKTMSHVTKGDCTYPIPCPLPKDVAMNLNSQWTTRLQTGFLFMETLYIAAIVPPHWNPLEEKVRRPLFFQHCTVHRPKTNRQAPFFTTNSLFFRLFSQAPTPQPTKQRKKLTQKNTDRSKSGSHASRKKKDKRRSKKGKKR